MKRFVLLLLALSFACLSANIRDNIHHAGTYYWLGIGEQGDMDSFARALEYLDIAESQLKNPDLQETDRLLYSQQINALKDDVLYQQDMAHDTFFGVFPLNRVLGGTIFGDAGAYGTFEFIDDPDVIAVCNGAEKVVETLNRSLKYSPQYGVVINSNPPNRALENEVRYIFNLDPRFFVHTYQEITSALTPKELKMFEGNELDSSLITRLCEMMNNPYLSMVTIYQIDIVDDVYFFTVEADTYWDNEGVPKFKMAKMSFCRDKRKAFIPVWINNFIFFGLALLVFFLFNLNNAKNKTLNWTMPLLAFLWGRMLPWVFNPLLISFRPLPETLVKLSFWWLVIYGIVLIFGVMLTWYILSKRARIFIKNLAPEGQGDIALICVGLGLAAYFGEVVLIYNTALLALVAVNAIIITFTGYILGSALDCTRVSGKWFIVIALLISALFGIIFTRIQLLEVLILGALSFILGTLAFMQTKKKVVSDLSETDCAVNIPDLSNLSNLSDRITKPLFQKYDAFNSGLEKIENFRQGTTGRLILVGPSGRGKTATAEALIGEIKSIATVKTLVLRGECPNQESHMSPYAPIQQALGNITGINFNSMNQDNSQMDSVLDSLMDSVIPFSSLLIPEDNCDSGLHSREQLNNLIFNSLQKMCRKSGIILFIDDLQWVDDATKDFLIYLNERLENDNKIPLLLLFTTRTEESAFNLGLNPENFVPIKPLSNQEKELILSNGLGFQPALSRDLLLSFGNITKQKGEMFFLLSVLSELARESAFENSGSGYTLSKKYKSFNQLPIPNSFADSVLEQLQRVSSEKMIIQCAACIGLEFEVEILAGSLDISRLDLLYSLNKIETETNLIFDVGESDDIYAFTSSAVLEVMRSRFQILNFGPVNPQVPQIIREFHARIAQVLMETEKHSVFRIANHFYAAGKLYADKAIEYCIKSAHSAAGLFQHDNARKYLAMAKECAEITNRVGELEGEFLQLEISESLVQNTHQTEIADKARVFLKQNKTLNENFLLLICKSFYNAGLASGDQQYFRKAVATATRLSDTCDDDFILAESKQMLAISLDRSRQDEIITTLQEAYSALLKVEENNIRTKELLSRIENSLAERLTYGTDEERLQAEKLFLHSIKIKDELADKPGLARSWGGLGRLYLEKGNVPEARTCFQKDLEICHQIGDVGGETKMYSFIADCYSREKDYVNAESSYKLSYDSANNLNDKLFAARGLIIVGLLSNSTEDFTSYSQFLLENRQTAIGIWSEFFAEINTLKNKVENLQG